MKSAVSKVMWVGRATVFLVGLSVILAVVLGVASAAFARNGDPLKLGSQKNTATKITALIGKVATGPALSVRNPSGGQALDLQVNSGQAPMSVNSSTKVASLNADQVDGKSDTAFVSSNVIKRESAVQAGTPIGNPPDGTFAISQPCNPGETLLSGGPANVSATSTMVESFPTPGTTNSWTARINKNGLTDNFSVVVLCASP
jgi:hypothetical protein